MNKYYVDFNFEETASGRQPMSIAQFKTLAEAEEFASRHNDAVVGEYIEAWTWTTTGKKVKLF